jgi:hypothetical protein
MQDTRRHAITAMTDTRSDSLHENDALPTARTVSLSRRTASRRVRNLEIGRVAIDAMNGESTSLGYGGTIAAHVATLELKPARRNPSRLAASSGHGEGSRLCQIKQSPWNRYQCPVRLALRIGEEHANAVCWQNRRRNRAILPDYRSIRRSRAGAWRCRDEEVRHTF